VLVPGSAGTLRGRCPCPGGCSGRGLKKSAARTYDFSGRTWTPLILTVRCVGDVERKAGWPGLPHNGKERAGTKGKSEMAGVPSQWKGTGRDKGGKAGWPGFPHNGKERARTWGKAGWPRFPQNEKERAGTGGRNGMAGVPSQWEETDRDKGEKRDGRGSLTMGRNGPGQRGKSGMAGVPSQWEGTGQDKGKSGIATVPSK
jgi:hypothetical protein